MDVQKEYTELALLKKYKEVTGETVYGNGTTEEGLIKLVESLNLGYTATNKDPAFRVLTKDNAAKFFLDAIKDGKFVLVRYESPVGYGWKVVIGIDDMGTEYTYDDVIITADSCDYWDGHQDGCDVFSAYKFYRKHTNSKHTSQFVGMVIDKPQA